MTTKEKLDKFIENAAVRTESIAIEDLIKSNKENLKKGTLENYNLFDR